MELLGDPVGSADVNSVPDCLTECQSNPACEFWTYNYTAKE